VSDKYVWHLAGGYTVLLAFILFTFHFYPRPNDEVIEGRLMDGEIAILSWAFGSSVGSRMKDNVIAQQGEKK